MYAVMQRPEIRRATVKITSDVMHTAEPFSDSIPLASLRRLGVPEEGAYAVRVALSHWPVKQWNGARASLG